MTKAELFCRGMLTLVLCATPVRAANIAWAGAVNGNWNDAAKWTPAQVPSTNDTAVITNAGTYIVTLNVNPFIAGLLLGGSSGTQTLATAGRTLTLNGTATIGTNAVFYMNGGLLTGSATYDVDGYFQWIAGEVASNAEVNVATGALCEIASSAKHAKSLNGKLSNAGATTWKPIGALVLGGTLHNLAGGTFEIQNDNESIIKPGGHPAVINDGVFRKTGGGGNINCYVAITNNATIDIQTGTLTLLESSAFNDGCSFTGAGKTQLSGGTNILAGTMHSENLNLLYSATLAGTGTVRGTMVWGGGYIAEDAVLTLATNGILRVASAVQFGKFLYGDLFNAGTIVLQSLGNLNVAGSLHNLPSGLIDIQTDNISIAEQDGGARVINAGIIRKSGGTIGNNCYVAVTNSGTLQIQTGKLNFQGGFANPGGTVLVEGGNFQSNQGLDLQDGELAGWSTVYASATNGGIVRPSRTNGVLTISGDYVQNQVGTTVFELGGNQPGVNQSKLNVTGNAVLGGFIDVELEDGYLPEPGTNCTVMAFASHQGEFAFQNGFYLLGHGRRLEPVYTPAALTLATVAAPEPTAVPLVISSENGAVMVAWPTEFSGCNLYSKTNLLESGWTPVPSMGNQYLEPPPLPPEKFFGLF